MPGTGEIRRGNSEDPSNKVNTPFKGQVQPCKCSDDDFLCRVNVQGMWCTCAIIRRKWFTAPEIPYNLLKCPPSTTKVGSNEDIHVKLIVS
jgi:hypothetical protein